MQIEIFSEDLHRLIRSVKPPYGGNHMSVFTGNQWNEDWSWKPDAFKDFTDVQLWNFYIEVSGQSSERKIEEAKEVFSWPHHTTYK